MEQVCLFKFTASSKIMNINYTQREKYLIEVGSHITSRNEAGHWLLKQYTTGNNNGERPKVQIDTKENERMQIECGLLLEFLGRQKDNSTRGSFIYKTPR